MDITSLRVIVVSGIYNGTQSKARKQSKCGMTSFNLWNTALVVFAVGLIGVLLQTDFANPEEDAPADYAWILDDDHDTVEVGDDDGPDDAFFGSIYDVLVQDSIIHVLDGQEKQLSATSFSGRRLAEIGSEGQGPDEFMRPRKLIQGNEGRLVVYDLLGSMKSFEFASASSEPLYKLHDTRDFLRSAWDICRGGEDLFMYPENQPGTIWTEGEGERHQLAYLPFSFDDKDGEIRYFGARPAFMNDVPEQFMYRASQGAIHCTANHHILAAHVLDNSIDIYDRSGQEVGTIDFESLQPPTLEVARYDGRELAGVHLDSAYQVSSMVSLDDRHVLIQFTSYPEDFTEQHDDEPLKQHTYVIDVRTLEATLLGTTHKTFHHVTDAHYVASANVPYPMIYIGSKQ